MSLQIGILLTRAPLQVKPQPALKTAYFSFKDALERSSARKFNPDFYFKKGSTAEQIFNSCTPDQDTIGGLASIPKLQEAEINNIQFINEKPNLKQTDLNRKATDDLYLVVKQNGKWTIPIDSNQPSEVLHQSASRIIAEKLGKSLNFWVVGKVPVGHLNNETPVFVMKARILKGRIADTVDHAWFSREEMVQVDCFEELKDLL